MYRKISWNLISPSLKDEYKKLFEKINELVVRFHNIKGVLYIFNDTDKGVLKIDATFEKNKLYFTLYIDDEIFFHFILIKNPKILFLDWEILEESNSNILKTQEDFSLIFSLLEKKERFLTLKEAEAYNKLKEINAETNGVFNKNKES